MRGESSALGLDCAALGFLCARGHCVGLECTSFYSVAATNADHVQPTCIDLSSTAYIFIAPYLPSNAAAAT